MNREEAKKNLIKIIEDVTIGINADGLTAAKNDLDLAKFIIQPEFKDASPAAGSDDERKKYENKNLLTIILEEYGSTNIDDEKKKYKEEAIEAIVSIFQEIVYSGDKKNKSKPIVDLLTTAKTGDKSSLALIIEAQDRDKNDYLAAIKDVAISSQEPYGKTIGVVITESTGIDSDSLDLNNSFDEGRLATKYIEEKYNISQAQYNDELKISAVAIQTLDDIRQEKGRKALDGKSSPRENLQPTIATNKHKNPSQFKTDIYIDQLKYQVLRDAYNSDLKIIRPTAESSGIKEGDLDKKAVAIKSDNVGQDQLSTINPSKIYDEFFTKQLINHIGNHDNVADPVQNFVTTQGNSNFLQVLEQNFLKDGALSTQGHKLKQLISQYADANGGLNTKGEGNKYREQGLINFLKNNKINKLSGFNQDNEDLFLQALGMIARVSSGKAQKEAKNNNIQSPKRGVKRHGTENDGSGEWVGMRLKRVAKSENSVIADNTTTQAQTSDKPLEVDNSTTTPRSAKAEEAKKAAEEAKKAAEAAEAKKAAEEEAKKAEEEAKRKEEEAKRKEEEEAKRKAEEEAKKAEAEAKKAAESEEAKRKAAEEAKKVAEEYDNDLQSTSSEGSEVSEDIKERDKSLEDFYESEQLNELEQWIGTRSTNASLFDISKNSLNNGNKPIEDDALVTQSLETRQKQGQIDGTSLSVVAQGTHRKKGTEGLGRYNNIVDPFMNFRSNTGSPSPSPAPETKKDRQGVPQGRGGVGM